MGYLAIFFTILFFSTIEVVSKIIGNDIDPIYLAFLRFFLSGIVLISFDFKKIKKIKKNDFIKLTLLGILGVTISLGAFHLSLKYIDAARGAVIFSLNPIFSTIFAWLILKEKMNTKIGIGIFIGFIGAYIVCFGFDLINFKSLTGPLLMLISATSFGAYIVLAKKYIKLYGPFFTTGFVFFTGSLWYLPFIKSYNILNFSKNIGYIAYLIILGTGVAYVFYFYGLRKIPVSAGSSMFYLKPVLASIFAYYILKENFKVSFFTGIILIIIGMSIILIPERKFLFKKNINKGESK
ncbi:DMT family transporter [Haliovirga abyssi]|uniref:Membrane protein n=1 Tax=Haliovirga abyssi TaxID=2996794 RepID=A0AAU9DGP5_9FUSO|nr:DMT family transporter [Haliovirga abyssi]BDU51443.1 membrane protein [Haliovirga abyssi]